MFSDVIVQSAVSVSSKFVMALSTQFTATAPQQLLLLLLLHPFYGHFSRTTWLSQYQKGKTSLDLNEARDDGLLGMEAASAGPYANSLHLVPDT